MSSPFDVTVVVGQIRTAEPFPAAQTPELVKLWIDLGEDHGEIQSAAQLGYNYDVPDLPGRQVLCVIDLGTVTIAGFESEALTLGVPDEDGNPVLVGPAREVPLGGELY